MSMKTNLVSPTTLGSNQPRADTRAKIIAKVRGGGAPAHFSIGPAFNWAFIGEDKTTNNVEVTYTQEVVKPISENDEVSLPTTASTSHDSTDDSIFGGVTNDEGKEEAVEALQDGSVLTDIVTNINNPGVGFTKCTMSDTTFTATMNDRRSPSKKKVSFDEDNSIFDDEHSVATSPPKRRLFNCGDDDLIDDLNVTLKQIFSCRSNFRNVRRNVPETNDLSEQLSSFKSRRSRRYPGISKNDSDVSDESFDSYSGNGEKLPSKLYANGNKRRDRVSEFKAMMSRRKEV